MSRFMLKMSLLALLGVLIQPAPVKASGADDGKSKKSHSDNCENAIKKMPSGTVPRSVLPLPWCMDPQTGMHAGMLGKAAPGAPAPRAPKEANT